MCQCTSVREGFTVKHYRWLVNSSSIKIKSVGRISTVDGLSDVMINHPLIYAKDDIQHRGLNEQSRGGSLLSYFEHFCIPGVNAVIKTLSVIKREDWLHEAALWSERLLTGGRQCPSEASKTPMLEETDTARVWESFRTGNTHPWSIRWTLICKCMQRRRGYIYTAMINFCPDCQTWRHTQTWAFTNTGPLN